MVNVIKIEAQILKIGSFALFLTMVIPEKIHTPPTDGVLF